MKVLNYNLCLLLHHQKENYHMVRVKILLKIEIIKISIYMNIKCFKLNFKLVTMSETNSAVLAYERILGTLTDKSIEFKNKLLSNYLHFLHFKSKDAECYPSDLINRLWNSHVLDTKGYIYFCYTNFGKIIHHDPNDGINQEKRQARLIATINHFKNANIIVDKDIWQHENKFEIKLVKINKSDCEKNNIIFYMKTYDDKLYDVMTNKQLTIYEFYQALVHYGILQNTNYRFISDDYEYPLNYTFEQCKIKNKSKVTLVERLKS